MIHAMIDVFAICPKCRSTIELWDPEEAESWVHVNNGGVFLAPSCGEHP